MSDEIQILGANQLKTLHAMGILRMQQYINQPRFFLLHSTQQTQGRKARHAQEFHFSFRERAKV